MLVKDKSSNILVIGIISLIILLPLLAGLQYYWLGQLSEAEKVRMLENLKISTQRFSEDFDREMTRIYSGFKLPSNIMNTTKQADILKNIYLQWKERSVYPRLIENIYLVNINIKGDPDIFRLDTANVKLNKVSWPETIGHIKKHFEKKDRNILSQIIPITYGPILDKTPVIITGTEFESFEYININFEEDACIDLLPYLIIKLSNDILQNDLIPVLTRKYFAQQDIIAYNIIIAKDDGSEEIFYKSQNGLSMEDLKNPDAASNIGRWRTQDFIFATNEIKIDYEGETTNKIETRLSGKNLSIKVIKKDTLNSREASQFFIASRPAWKLFVKHRSGSLDTIVANTRQKNLLISYVILSVLGIAIFFALSSASRMRKLANQQMEFVAGITHELRTPLSVIQSAGENIADGLINDHKQIKRYGELIRDEGRRLTNRVEQTLEFAGIQSGKKNFNMTSIDLTKLLEKEVKKLLQAGDGNLEINKDIQPDQPAIIGDPHALSAVMENLITNAMKFCKESGSVSIESSQVNDEVEIQISDDGIGISKKDLPHIFEPFYRGKNVIDAQIRGNGLGLSIVKNIVEVHLGRIKVESKLAAGTTFTIYLPIKNDKEKDE